LVLGRLDSVFLRKQIPLHLLRLWRKRRARNDQVVHLSFIESRILLPKSDERERESRYMIPILQKATQVIQA
jgi:hypothetical protein